MPAPKPTQPKAPPAKKPKPAESGEFQRSLVTDLVGMGLLSTVVEVAGHTEALSNVGGAPAQGGAVAAVSPKDAIKPSRRFVPR
jgi:hypothetical protein